MGQKKTVVYGDLEADATVQDVQNNKQKKQISFNRPFEALKDLKLKTEPPEREPAETKDSE